jgi:hypothetical protein
LDVRAGVRHRLAPRQEVHDGRIVANRFAFGKALTPVRAPAIPSFAAQKPAHTGILNRARDAPVSRILLPVYVGPMHWRGLYLRDPRFRALIPFRGTTA